VKPAVSTVAVDSGAALTIAINAVKKAGSIIVTGNGSTGNAASPLRRT
jgi:hypothetical protein